MNRSGGAGAALDRISEGACPPREGATLPTPKEEPTSASVTGTGRGRQQTEPTYKDVGTIPTTAAGAGLGRSAQERGQGHPSQVRDPTGGCQGSTRQPPGYMQYSAGLSHLVGSQDPRMTPPMPEYPRLQAQPRYGRLPSGYYRTPAMAFMGRPPTSRSGTHTHRKKVLQEAGLVAVDTTGGYVVFGPVWRPQDLPEGDTVLYGSVLSEVLQRFWESEEPPTADRRKPEDDECELFYQYNTARCSSGRFVTRLPFLPNRPALELLAGLPGEFHQDPHLFENPDNPNTLGILGVQYRPTHDEWPFNECRAPLGPPDRGLRVNAGQLVPKPNPASLLERYSSLDKLLGVTGWIKRFVNNCRKPQAERNYAPVLSPAERNAALCSLVRVVQAEHFEEEVRLLRDGLVTYSRLIVRTCARRKYRGESLFRKKGNKERRRRTRVTRSPESLIPVRSWTADAMPQLPAEPVAPPLAIAAFIACVAGAAALAHCAIIAALLKQRLTNGLFSILIQLAIADTLLLGTTAGPELWSLNSRTWQFGTTGCIAYQGLNVFTSTLSTYLLIAIALHTLTTIRLEEKAADRRKKRNSSDEEEEIRSSQHSLVANSDSSTPPRTMNVDYRMANTGIPVTMPTIFIWILAVSLSIPEYALATISHPGKNVSICTLDSNHQSNVYSMLAVFNLFLPLFLISVASAFVIVKLKTKKKVLSGVLECSESVAALKLSLCLMCLHVLLCAPRNTLSAYRVYSSSVNGNESALDFAEQSDMVALINLTLSSAYLTATLIRPLLSIMLLPQLRCLFRFDPRISNV
ncbi:7 transmembrane receptor (rhodopsin family) domain-containing protein [Phthorimaea operculella]|nr:7 transmembrane receptor (rhodopsin family) domain-containing protein [Phthorimaea operculella]